MSENENMLERHGCIVFGKIFDVLPAYTLKGRSMMEFTVASPGGHVMPDKGQPLVACNTHTAGEVESAYKRSRSTKSKESDQEQEPVIP